VIWGK